MSSQVDSGAAVKRFATQSLLRVGAWVVRNLCVSVWLSAAVGLPFERGVRLLSAVLVVEPAANGADTAAPGDHGGGGPGEGVAAAPVPEATGDPERLCSVRAGS